MKQIEYPKTKNLNIEPAYETFRRLQTNRDELRFAGALVTEHAVSYGHDIMPRLTDALNRKLHLLELYKRSGDSPTFWRDYGHHHFGAPKVIWGVVGANLIIGTIAAEQAIQEEAKRAEYASEIAFPQDRGGYYDQVWCELAITNPEWQTYPRLYLTTVPPPLETSK